MKIEAMRWIIAYCYLLASMVSYSLAIYPIEDFYSTENILAPERNVVLDLEGNRIGHTRTLLRKKPSVGGNTAKPSQTIPNSAVAATEGTTTSPVASNQDATATPYDYPASTVLRENIEDVKTTTPSDILYFSPPDMSKLFGIPDTKKTEANVIKTDGISPNKQPEDDIYYTTVSSLYIAEIMKPVGNIAVEDNKPQKEKSSVLIKAIAKASGDVLNSSTQVGKGTPNKTPTKKATGNALNVNTNTQVGKGTLTKTPTKKAPGNALNVNTNTQVGKGALTKTPTKKAPGNASIANTKYQVGKGAPTKQPIKNGANMQSGIKNTKPITNANNTAQNKGNVSPQEAKMIYANVLKACNSIKTGSCCSPTELQKAFPRCKIIY